MRNLLQHISLVTALVFAFAGLAAGQLVSDKTPHELEGVQVDEHLGAQLDLDLQFTAEDGYQHSLREYFKGGRPVILNLVYYTCPMLCNLVLNGQVSALRKMDGTPGKEFEIVTISIDPTENYAIARSKKASYLESYERPAPGWHFLTDYNGSTARLASQVGFNYRMDEKTGQYAHAAVIFVITPEGKVSRYLYGVTFLPFDVKMAVTEAAQGRTGPTIARFLRFCYSYDPDGRRYFLDITRVSAAFTVLLAVGFGIALVVHRKRRPRPETKESP